MASQKRPANKRAPRAPSRAAVRKAVTASGGTEGGKVLKVMFLSDKGEPVGEYASTQIPEAFTKGQMRGLQEPPFKLEQLVYLAEAHPVHSSALEQKTADVCGTGWEWESIDPEESADDEARKEMTEWFEALAPDDEDMQEVLSAVWNDVETIGWGLAELARDPQGILAKVYHVPGHTVRAHQDGFRLCQIRGTHKVWFRRWGATDINGQKVEVNSKTGSLTKHDEDNKANDLFVVKRKSRRSSWYGIPGYVSAIGHITLALAARDDNLYFFANRREPRWAIILSNLSNDPDLEEDLRRAFTIDLKQPYRNIVVPLVGNAKVDFQKLTDNSKLDGTFDKLSERADTAIMVGHRIPADRLANATTGPLGGNSNIAANRVYKEGVVSPSQELIDSRLNRLIAVEFELAKSKPPALILKLDDLDIDTEADEIELVERKFKADLITLREARSLLKLEPLMVQEVDEVTGEPTGEPIESPLNDKLYTEMPGVGKGAGGGDEPPESPDLGSLIEAMRGDTSARGILVDDVAELLRESRRQGDALDELSASERPAS